MVAVAVVGTKKAGKTTTTENLVKELTKRGYKVAAIKHISEPEFTIDTPGKDTWRFAQSGARTIISVAAEEVATIEKVQIDTVRTEQLLRKCKGNDIVLIEGLKKRLSSVRSIWKIVVVKSREEAVKALKSYRPILAFSGPYNAEGFSPNIPYVDGLANPEKLSVIIEERLLKK
jgi:molybdopterin-guanine dinucleotide biosynthesis protein B